MARGEARKKIRVICVLKHWRGGVVKDRMHEIETDVRVLD
jgi:hypothetical protein